MRYLMFLTTLSVLVLVSACADQPLGPTPGGPQAAEQQQQSGDIPPPVAKSGPSFSQTRDFIVAKLSSYGGLDWTGSMREEISDVHIDNSCNLSFMERKYFASDGNGDAPNASSSGPVTIALGAITQLADVTDGTRDTGIEFVTGNINAISLRIPNDAPASSYYAVQILRTPTSQPGAEVTDSAQDMRIHLKNALWHLVGMCKERYFSRPKKLEPF